MIKTQIYVIVIICVFHLVLVEFGLDESEGGNAKILDQYNTSVLKEMFGIIVKQFQNCSNFYLKVIISSDENFNYDIILEEYLKANNCKFIFTEFRTTTSVSDESFTCLCDTLMKYIKEYIRDFDKAKIVTLCKSAIRIFPCLKTEPSIVDGIVSLLTILCRHLLFYKKIFFSQFVLRIGFAIFPSVKVL